VAVFLAAAVGGIQGLVDRDDDVGHGDVAGLATQGVATARSTGGLDQLMPPQFPEELFQIRQRDLLTL
jgi:hypothetical protein